VHWDQKYLAIVSDLHRHGHKALGVDVLDLAPGAQVLKIAALAERFIGAGLAHRDVDVGAHGALVHVAIARAQIAHDGAQLAHIGGRFVWAPHVRLGDNLHQRHTGSVEIHVGGRWVKIVDRLAGVLLKVQPLNADDDGLAILKLNLDLTLTDDRVFELRDLVALRQVWIEVVLAIKAGAQVDFSVEAQPSAHRLLDAECVDHRQHSRHGRIHKADMRVRRAAVLRRGPGKELGFGRDLGVHLQAHNHFPIARFTGQRVARLCHVFGLACRFAPFLAEDAGQANAPRPWGAPRASGEAAKLAAVAAAAAHPRNAPQPNMRASLAGSANRGTKRLPDQREEKCDGDRV